jgi:hypothetical protein
VVSALAGHKLLPLLGELLNLLHNTPRHLQPPVVRLQWSNSSLKHIENPCVCPAYVIYN